MTDPRTRGDLCLDPETLAAYVDHRLDGDERTRAEAHLADCGYCRDAAVDVRELTAPNATARRTIIWRAYWLPLSAVAAVVVAALWFALSAGQPTGEPNAVPRAIDAEVTLFVSAMRNSRVIEPRLSAPFAWTPRTNTRGESSGDLPLEAREAALRIERLVTVDRNADTLWALGMSEAALGRAVAAIPLLEEAARLEPTRPRIHNDVAAAYLTLWERTKQATDASKALDAVDAALRLEPQLEPAVFNRSICLEALGLTEAAAASWESFLKISKDDQWRREAEAHAARLKRRQSEVVPPSLDELRRLSGDALLQLAADDPVRLERAIGQILHVILESDESLQSGRTALAASASALEGADRDRSWPQVVAAALAPSMSSRGRDCLRRAIVASDQSRELFDRSMYSDAATHARRAQSMFRCAGFASLDAAMQLAWIQFFENRRDSAIRTAIDLRSEADRRGHYRTLARAEYLIGLHAIARMQPDAGLAAYARAQHAARRSGDAELVALTATAQGEAYRNIGELDHAWRSHEVALQLLDRLSSRRRYVVLSGAVLTATHSNQRYVADALAKELVRVTERSGDAARLAGAHLHRARTLADLDYRDDARTEVARTDTLIARIGNATLRQQYRTELDWLSALLGRQTHPEGSVTQLQAVFETLANTGRPYRLAEVLLELGRARWSLGDQSGAIADWRRGLEMLEREEASIGDRQLRISRAHRLWELSGELVNAHLDDPAAALAIAERSRARALLDGLDANGAADLADVTSLPADVDVLGYVVLRDKLVMWHMRNSGVRLIVREISAGALERVVASFVSDVQRGSQHGTTLSALLLPQDVSLTGRRVVFLPDGALHRVPFSLLIQAATGRRLFQDTAPMIAPSLRLLHRRARAWPAGTPRVLLAGYGDAMHDEQLPKLPWVDDEIESLVRLYGGRALTRLTGRAATRKQFVSEIRNAGTVHFAGHAVSNELFPARSRLVIGGDAADVVTAADLSGVRLQTGATVVLSACDTATGRIYRGEGAMAMARSFLASGAAAVVATLWKVQDGESIPLVQELHRRLAGGSAPEVALAEAKRSVFSDTGSLRTVGVFEVMRASLGEDDNGR